MEAEEAEKQLRDYLLNGIVTEIVYTLMEEPGNTVYQLGRKIRLTAKTGAIASFVREARGTEPGGWRMNERDILVGVDADHDSQAVVVDLKPHARDIVSLYRMRGIVGYSYTDWTPICFLFERLFDDQAESDPKHFKQRFTREEGFRGLTPSLSCTSTAARWRAGRGTGGTSGGLTEPFSSLTHGATSTKKFSL
jgi:hypothetical protein